MTAVHGSSLHEATREMLVRERAAVASRMQSITQDALSLEFESDGVPPSGYQREEALTSILYSRLSDIDNALEQIDAGSYGTCVQCSTQIPARRMEAQPFAKLCVRCQSEADKRASRRVFR